MTRAACVDLGITPWEDPHNNNPEFTRVRLRHEALPLLEEILGGGVAEALARTATQLREDGEALDKYAEAYSYGLSSTGKWKWTHLPMRPPQSADALCGPGCCSAAQKH